MKKSLFFFLFMKASSAAGNSANSATAEALTGQPPPAPYPQANA